MICFLPEEMISKIHPPYTNESMTQLSTCVEGQFNRYTYGIDSYHGCITST